MPVLPDFSPQGAPGQTGRAFMDARDHAESWMDRAQRREAVGQEMEIRKRQMAMNELERPVKEAQLKAQISGIAASVANQTEMENLKAKANLVSTSANNEFLDVMQLADFNSKATALAGLQAKYQWMSLVPEYKGFVDTINNERVRAHGAAIADANMERMLEQSQIRQDQAVEVAQIGAGSRENVASTNAEARTAVADTNAAARENVAATTTQARATSSDENRVARVNIQKAKGLQASAIQADRDAAKANDEESAALYRKHAEEYRKQADAALAEPPKPVEFNVPGSEKPAGKKLYQAPAAEGEAPSFTSEVKNPDDVLSAVQQMVDDGVIDEEQARETLTKLGFKKKGG